MDNSRISKKFGRHYLQLNDPAPVEIVPRLEKAVVGVFTRVISLVKRPHWLPLRIEGQPYWIRAGDLEVMGGDGKLLARCKSSQDTEMAICCGFKEEGNSLVIDARNSLVDLDTRLEVVARYGREVVRGKASYRTFAKTYEKVVIYEKERFKDVGKSKTVSDGSVSYQAPSQLVTDFHRTDFQIGSKRYRPNDMAKFISGLSQQFELGDGGLQRLLECMNQGLLATANRYVHAYYGSDRIVASGDRQLIIPLSATQVKSGIVFKMTDTENLHVIGTVRADVTYDVETTELKIELSFQ